MEILLLSASDKLVFQAANDVQKSSPTIAKDERVPAARDGLPPPPPPPACPPSAFIIFCNSDLMSRVSPESGARQSLAARRAAVTGPRRVTRTNVSACWSSRGAPKSRLSMSGWAWPQRHDVNRSLLGSQRCHRPRFGQKLAFAY